MDQEARWGPEKCVHIANWDYKKDFQPGEFTLVVVHPSRQHDFTVAKKVLEIIQYLWPDRWWMTSVPQNKNVNEEMSEFPFIDCDCCQFEDCGFRKSTRVFGSEHIRKLTHVECDGENCVSLQESDSGENHDSKKHWRPLGGRRGKAKSNFAGYFPMSMVEYITGLNVLEDCRVSKIPVQKDDAPEGEEYEVGKVTEMLRLMRLVAVPEVNFQEDDDEDVISEIIPRL